MLRRRLGFVMRSEGAEPRPWRINASRRTTRGASAVEFGLILPVLAALTFGIIQWGAYFFSVQAGSQAVREAARRAAVGDLPGCTEFKNYVKDHVGQGAFDETSFPIQVKRSYTKDPANPSPVAGQVQVGDIVKVEVSFHTLDLNFVPVANDGQVTTYAETRVEHVPSATTISVCS